MTASSYKVHLLVLIHGLWGTRKHIEYIAESAIKHTARQNAPRSRNVKGEEVKLVVLNARLNESTNTYDGIDLCAERVLNEVDEEMKRVKEDGGVVDRFSIVG